MINCGNKNTALYLPSDSDEKLLFVIDNSAGYFTLDDDSTIGVGKLKELLSYNEIDLVESRNYACNSADTSLGCDVGKVTGLLLKQCDGIVIVNPRRKYSKDEIKLINGFVEDGGVLLLINDNPETIDNSNHLSSSFEVEYLRLLLGERITVSVGKYNLSLFRPIAVHQTSDSIRNYSINDPPFGNTTFFIEKKIGCGRIFFLTDSNLIKNSWIGRSDNKKFLLEIFNGSKSGDCI